MIAAESTSVISERVGRFVEQYGDEAVRSDLETRREHPRHTMSEPVDVLVDSTQTPAEVILATGRDISLGGIGVYTDRPLPPGTGMVLSIDNGREKLFAKAVAVHSTLSVGLFKIGARFVV